MDVLYYHQSAWQPEINTQIQCCQIPVPEGERQFDDALADVVRVSLYSVNLEAAEMCQKLLTALEALTLRWPHF